MELGAEGSSHPTPGRVTREMSAGKTTPKRLGPAKAGGGGVVAGSALPWKRGERARRRAPRDVKGLRAKHGAEGGNRGAGRDRPSAGLGSARGFARCVRAAPCLVSPGLQKNSLQNCFVELLTPSFARQESSLIFNCHKLLRFNCLTLTEVYLVFRLMWKTKF